MAPSKPALVGAFVLTGLALLVAALLLFGGMRFFSKDFHAITYFQGSVAGLEVGAPVTFRGVRVGSVTRIGINLDMRDLSGRIPVTLELDPSSVTLDNHSHEDPKVAFRRLKNAGLQAQLAMQSLVTGQLQVNLDLKPGERASYIGGNVSGDEIPSTPSKLATLEAELSDLPLKEIVRNANRTLMSIQQVADDLRPRVGPLMDSLKQTADSTQATMASARGALTQVDGLVGEGRQQLSANGDQLHLVLTASDKTVRDADALVTSLNDMTGRNSQMRSDLQSTTRDLAASADALRTFSQEIERNPSDLLRRGKPR